MLNFERSPREIELETRTREFIRKVVIPRERDPRRGAHGPSEQLLRELRAQARTAGLLAPHVGTAWGGLGLSHVETATVFRAAGYSLLGPLAMNCMAPDEGNMHLLEKVATREQQARFLAPLAAGEVRSCFLMTEPDGAGSDPNLLATVARRNGGDWIIDGRKWFITGAEGASFGIVMARTGNDATMFLADMNTPGMHIERLMDTLEDSMPGGHAVIRLEGVRIPASQVLGAVNEGFKYAQVRLAPARLTHCMRWWGAAQRAHDIALDYARRRLAFGKPLIEHEGVGFLLAQNEVDLTQTQLMIDYTAWVLDQGKRGTYESSVAKYSVAESLFRIADRCVQVLGGVGVTHETEVGKIFQGLRAFRIYDGPSEVHLWSIAKRLQRQGVAAAPGDQSTPKSK
jgi:acyl-CoA dehydrogenase